MLPQLIFDRQKTLAEATATLNEYINITENKKIYIEEARSKGIWLWDSPVFLLTAQMQGERPLSVLDILPYDDDWKSDWIIVEKILPDQRLVAVGMRDPTSVDFMEPLLWFVIIAVVSGFSCACLSWLLTVRLRDITKATQALSHGDLNVRLPYEQESGDEFSLLSSSFNGMVNNIASLMENERRLLCDISHELRGPLARMQLAVALLNNEDHTHQYLELLQKDLDRMGFIVESIIEKRKNSLNSEDYITEHIEIYEVLYEAIALANFEFHDQKTKAVLLTTPTPQDIAPILGIRTLLEQALYNIIINGLRYTKPGSNVELRLEKNGEEIMISIRDYGPGVPEACLDNLFRPFFRVEEARDQRSGSIGLGLSLARHYIERHNGKVAAVNVNPGLCVSVVLQQH